MLNQKMIVLDAMTTKNNKLPQSSRALSWLLGLGLAAAVVWLWLIPDGQVWWQANRPDLAAQRREIRLRDTQRQKDLDTIERKLATYVQEHRNLPSPKDYGGDDGDNWDVSTKGDFLRFLKGFWSSAPIDPINRAVNDPCNDTDSYGYGYSVTNLESKDSRKHTYILCTQLEGTRRSTERRKSVDEILNELDGGATTSTASPKAITR